MATEFHPKYLTVHNEGADLRVWYQGTGSLLILIQGGGGDGARFNASIPSLSEHYTVATYDRRGNASSTVAVGKPLNPVESARDVIRIIKALAFSKASIFGTSSGGLIALQLAADYPEYVEHAIIHEAPTLNLVPGQKTNRIDDAFQTYETWREYGSEAALEHFRSSGAGEPRKPPEGKYKRLEEREDRPPAHRLDYFFEHEFIVLNIYTPPLAQVRANGVSVVTVEGKETGEDNFVVLAARAQSEILSCKHVIWPSGHAAFVTDPKDFAQALLSTLDELYSEDKSVP